MTTRFWLLMGLVLVFALPVQAQEESGTAVPSAALETEAEAQAAEVAVAAEEKPVETAMAVPDDSDDKKENWELCPEPQDALNSVPSRLDDLQADIDRYTLCLNRAELLLKLEDLRSQNSGDLAGAGMTLPGSMTPAPLTEQQAGELLGEVGAATTTVPGSAAPAFPLEYGIRNISGVGGTLTARVQSPTGEFEQVHIGDRLGDGSEVTSITTTQVTIRTKDGVTKRLNWNN